MEVQREVVEKGFVMRLGMRKEVKEVEGRERA